MGASNSLDKATKPSREFVLEGWRTSAKVTDRQAAFTADRIHPILRCQPARERLPLLITPTTPEVVADFPSLRPVRCSRSATLSRRLFPTLLQQVKDGHRGEPQRRRSSRGPCEDRRGTSTKHRCWRARTADSARLATDSDSPSVAGRSSETVEDEASMASRGAGEGRLCKGGPSEVPGLLATLTPPEPTLTR